MSAPHPIHDLVVVLPGIMGSTLYRDGRPVWAPSGGALIDAIKGLGQSLGDLALPPDIGDGHPGDGIAPVTLMPDLHLLPGLWTWNIGYGRLLDWLKTRFDLLPPDPREPERIPNLLPVAYDWRLSNRYNARRLKGIVEPALGRWRDQGGPCADARLIFICHSMGGLIARWYLEQEGGAAWTRHLITLGTPHRGALEALSQLINGVPKALGPLRKPLDAFVRSLPSVYQLLPEYACIETPGGLCKTTEVTLPALDPGLVTDAMAFHNRLDAAPRPNPAYHLHPIVGTWQPTATTARIGANGAIESVETIAGANEFGDGTVPRLAATPSNMPPGGPGTVWVADQHGALQSNRAVFDQLEGILTAGRVVHRAPVGMEIGVHAEPLLLVGEPLVVKARFAGAEQLALLAILSDAAGQRVAQRPLRPAGDGLMATFDPPPAPGVWQIKVGGVGAAAALVAPVATMVVVW